MSDEFNFQQYLASVSGQDGSLRIPKWILSIVGNDFPAALLMNQLIYWSTRLPEQNEGWLHKSAVDWEKEIAITTYQLGRATKKLKEIGFPMTTRKAKSQYYKFAPVTQYKLDAEAITGFVKIHFVVSSKWEVKKLTNLNNIEYLAKSTNKKDPPPQAAAPPATSAEPEPPALPAQKEDDDAKPKRTYERHASGFKVGTVEPSPEQPIDAKLMLDIDTFERIYHSTLRNPPEPPAGDEFTDKNAQPSEDAFPIDADGQWQVTPPPIPLGELVEQAKAEADEDDDDLIDERIETKPNATYAAKITIIGQKLDFGDATLTLDNRDWSLLSTALYHKHGHVVALRSDTARIDKLTQAGVLRALKRPDLYKLTDDGRKWVDGNISKEWREKAVVNLERKQERKNSKAARREARRLEPPQPPGKKKVREQIEPIFNRFIQHWGKPATKTEHNTYVSTAWEFHNANGTPDEVTEIWNLCQANDWKTATVRNCVTKLGAIRKGREDVAALPSIADLDDDDFQPLDPEAGIAYTEE